MKRPRPERKLGTCRLCLAQKVPLRRSHILPKWTYKRSRDPSDRNPNPVLIFDEGLAVQTSYQLTEHLLCDRCEKRFGKEEDKVSTEVYQVDGRSKLPSLLGEMVTCDDDGERWMLPGRLELRHLVYFCSSVIWRASVCTEINKCSLGATEEAFRAYLHGEVAFPANAECVLRFYDQPLDGDLANFAYTPLTDSRPSYKVHHFHVFGLQCELYVGDDIPLTVTTASSSGPPQIFRLSPQRKLAAAWLPRIGGARRA